MSEQQILLPSISSLKEKKLGSLPKIELADSQLKEVNLEKRMEYFPINIEFAINYVLTWSKTIKELIDNNEIQNEFV